MDAILKAIDIRHVMRTHAVLCAIVGTVCVFLPHHFYVTEGTDYNQWAHECVRLYGCLTLGIGWFVERTRLISDGRFIQSVTEVFSLCYFLQALVMLKAHFGNPEGHFLVHWVMTVSFFITSLFYLYIRVFKKLKDFELPSQYRDT